MKPPFILTETEYKDPVLFGRLLLMVERHFAGRKQKQPFVGTAEVAEMMGIAKPHVAARRKAGQLPDPVADLSSGPVWLRRDVEPYAEALAKSRKARRAAAKS